MEKKSSGSAIASLVLSIISIVVCFIPFINFVSYIFGVIALILAIVAICKKSSKGLAIASIILVVIALFIATNINNATSNAINEAGKELDKTLGNSTEEVLKNDVEVNLGSLSITTDEYGLIDTEMQATVKNITDKKLSYSFHVEAVDASGNRIEEDYIYVSDLGPGQTTTEKIFTFISSDKIDAMRNATFKIIEASAY